MSTPHEVLSALLDNEPLDTRELAAALEEPAARAVLIDLVTLRQMVQPREPVPVSWTAPRPGPPRWQLAAAAALLMLGLTGGYFAGERTTAPGSTEAPAPTRVVEAVPFIPTGGLP